LKNSAILHHRSCAAWEKAWFDVDCRACERLTRFRDEVKREHPDYYCKPVPPFGDARARLIIVGLAPGKHGANRTGRPFTGDYAGELLYATLHKFGFGTRTASTSADDELKLLDCRISNAVKCLPPANKPEPAEIKTCNRYLAAELRAAAPGTIILALGQIAHQAVLLALDLKRASYRFAHGAQHTLPNGFILFDSYHCSRYNTQTRRLTVPMFETVVGRIRERLLEHA
jgi:uracil-DNA glycosylase